MAVSTVSHKVSELPHQNPYRSPAKEYALTAGVLSGGNAAAATVIGRTTEVDLTVGRSIQLNVDVATAGGTDMNVRPQYSTDGSNWNEFGAGATVVIDATGWSASEWVGIPADARSERCRIRLTAEGGDASTTASLDRTVLRVI